jgi:hypothetical protein
MSAAKCHTFSASYARSLIAQFQMLKINRIETASLVLLIAIGSFWGCTIVGVENDEASRPIAEVPLRGRWPYVKTC